MQSRFYTASEIAEHYGKKWNLKFSEEDIEKIIQSVSPEQEKHPGLFSDEAFQNFESYFQTYAKQISPIIYASDRALDEPTMSERLENLEEQYEIARKRTEMTYLNGEEKTEKELKHYEKIQENLKETRKDLDTSSQIIDSLYKKDYKTPIDKYNRIEESLYCLDDAEKRLDVIEQILKFDKADEIEAESGIERDNDIETEEKVSEYSEAGFEEEEDILDELKETPFVPIVRKDAISNIHSIGTGAEIEESPVEDIAREYGSADAWEEANKKEDPRFQLDKDTGSRIVHKEDIDNENVDEAEEYGEFEEKQEKTKKKTSATKRKHIDQYQESGFDEKPAEPVRTETNKEEIKNQQNEEYRRRKENEEKRKQEYEENQNGKEKSSEYGESTTGDTSSENPNFKRDEQKDNSRILTEKDTFKEKEQQGLNIFGNPDVQNAIRSVKKTYEDMSGMNETNLAEGSRKIRPATEAMGAIAMIGAGYAANKKGLEELKSVDFEKIGKEFKNAGIVDDAKKVGVSSIKDRNRYREQADNYFESTGIKGKDGKPIKNISRMKEEDLRELLKNGNLTASQKIIAESILKVNKLGAGDIHIKRGQANLRRSGINFAKRLTDNNDVTNGAFLLADVGRNVRRAYKYFQKTMKGVGVLGARTKEMALKLTPFTVTTETVPGKAGHIARKRIKINPRPKTMKAARQIAQAKKTGGILGATKEVAKMGTSVVQNGLSFTLGKGVKGVSKVKHAILHPLDSIKEIYKISIKGAAGASNVMGVVITKLMFILGVWCCLITACMTGIGGCVGFFAAIFSYTNDAFTISDNLLENVLNIFDKISLDSNEENGDGDGLESNVYDSVGYAALQNASKFYQHYDEIVYNGVKKKIKQEKTKNDCQDISDVFINNSPAEMYVYNDIPGNEEISDLIENQKQLKNVKPVTYYISANSIVDVLSTDTEIGSTYPYWNASEILSMSSVRYSNSINPYNYRRYNRILRYHAYGCDVGVIQSVANWFKDWIGLADGDGTNGVKLDQNEIFVEKIDSDSNYIYDPDYNNETVYIGFTKLTTGAEDETSDDMYFLTNGAHLNYKEYSETHHGEYDEDIADKLLLESEKDFKETHLCNNYNDPIVEHNTWEVEEDDDDEDGGTHTVTYTSYTVTFKCEGHYLAQAYVRCPTLTGTGNLYQVDDENPDTQGLLADIVDYIYPPTYSKWAEADGGYDENGHYVSGNEYAKEAKEEVAEMLTENWESTYGFTWKEACAGVGNYSELGAQLEQGNWETEDEDGNKTALGWAKEYLEKQKDIIQDTVQTELDPIWVRRIEIVDTAVSYAGRLKYYYGANDVANGISDCSAFISDAIGIERTTTGNIMGWKHISYSDLQPGDLLCKNGHVRMYICKLAVNGEIRYLTVENTSGSNSTDYVHGCSCALYTGEKLASDGYVGIDITDKIQ